MLRNRPTITACGTLRSHSAGTAEEKAIRRVQSSPPPCAFPRGAARPSITNHSVSQGTQHGAFSCNSGRRGAVNQTPCTAKVGLMPNMKNFYKVCATEREEPLTSVAHILLKCSNCISLSFHLVHMNGKMS